MKINVNGRWTEVQSQKAAFYAQALANAIENSADYVKGKLARAMQAVLNPTQHADGGAAVVEYFGTDTRFVLPASQAVALEGTVLNALIANGKGTRGALTEEQQRTFGAIEADEIAAFIEAAHDTSVRCDDGRLYDLGSYIHDLNEVGSKDAQALAACFGMQNPTANTVLATFEETWTEGGVKQAPAIRRDRGIEIPDAVTARSLTALRTGATGQAAHA